MKFCTAIKRVRLAYDAADADNANPTLGLLRSAPGEEAAEAVALRFKSVVTPQKF